MKKFIFVVIAVVVAFLGLTPALAFHSEFFLNQDQLVMTSMTSNPGDEDGFCFQDSTGNWNDATVFLRYKDQTGRYSLVPIGSFKPEEKFKEFLPTIGHKILLISHKTVLENGKSETPKRLDMKICFVSYEEQKQVIESNKDEYSKAGLFLASNAEAAPLLFAGMLAYTSVYYMNVVSGPWYDNLRKSRLAEVTIEALAAQLAANAAVQMFSAKQFSKELMTLLASLEFTYFKGRDPKDDDENQKFLRRLVELSKKYGSRFASATTKGAFVEVLIEILADGEFDGMKAPGDFKVFINGLIDSKYLTASDLLSLMKTVDVAKLLTLARENPGGYKEAKLYTSPEDFMLAEETNFWASAQDNGYDHAQQAYNLCLEAVRGTMGSVVLETDLTNGTLFPDIAISGLTVAEMRDVLAFLTARGLILNQKIEDVLYVSPIFDDNHIANIVELSTEAEADHSPKTYYSQVIQAASINLGVIGFTEVQRINGVKNAYQMFYLNGGSWKTGAALHIKFSSDVTAEKQNEAIQYLLNNGIFPYKAKEDDEWILLMDTYRCAYAYSKEGAAFGRAVSLLSDVEVVSYVKSSANVGEFTVNLKNTSIPSSVLIGRFNHAGITAKHTLRNAQQSFVFSLIGSVVAKDLLLSSTTATPISGQEPRVQTNTRISEVQTLKGTSFAISTYLNSALRDLGHENIVSIKKSILTINDNPSDEIVSIVTGLLEAKVHKGNSFRILRKKREEFCFRMVLELIEAGDKSEPLYILPKTIPSDVGSDLSVEVVEDVPATIRNKELEKLEIGEDEKLYATVIINGSAVSVPIDVTALTEQETEAFKSVFGAELDIKKALEYLQEKGFGFYNQGNPLVIVEGQVKVNQVSIEDILDEF